MFPSVFSTRTFANILLVAAAIVAVLFAAGCAALPIGPSVQPTATFVIPPTPTRAPTEAPTPTASVVPTPLPVPTPTLIPTASPSAGGFTRVKIFFIALEDSGKSGKKIGCNDSIVAVERQIAPTTGVLRAALNELLSVHDQYYGESGLYNALYQSDLKVQSVSIVNGMATIRLTGTYALGGVCDNPRFQAQIEETARQFPTVRQVSVFINGVPLAEILSGR
jgi:hypothetical protein